MAKKEFGYRGKSLQELKELSLNEFVELLPARQRRTLKRGFSEQQKKLLNKIREKKANIETHCRDMIIIPEMIGATIKVHHGNGFTPIIIQDEMIGRYIGEFVLTRKKVAHSAPGIGATKSSASISVK